MNILLVSKYSSVYIFIPSIPTSAKYCGQVHGSYEAVSIATHPNTIQTSMCQTTTQNVFF